MVPGFTAQSGGADGGALSVSRPGPPGPGPPVATTRNADAVNKHVCSVANQLAIARLPPGPAAGDVQDIPPRILNVANPRTNLEGAHCGAKIFYAQGDRPTDCD